MSLSVVVGFRPAGAATARLLAEKVHSVRVVTKSGRRPEPGIEHVAWDATDSKRLIEAVRGAAAIYSCAAPPYHRWASEWSPLASSVCAAAEASGAVLVMLGNLYGYSPVDGPLTEELPLAATGPKGRARAAVWEQARKLHEQGRIKVVEVRASDFFGPGVTDGGHLSLPRKREVPPPRRKQRSIHGGSRMTTPGQLSPRNVADVIARMRALGGALPPDDGVAVFNGIYLSVTEEVRLRLGSGHFRRPAAAARLTTLFGRRYLDAVAVDAAGGRAPDCWRPLFRARRHPRLRPVQFALSGINAHIGYDLALAVVETCRELGCEPPLLEDDFRLIGKLLAGMEQRVREELMPGPDLLELTDPLTHLVGVWSMAKAREAAWSAAGVLWAIRELPEVAEEFTRRLDAGVGLIGRCLLTPLGEGG